MCFIKAAQNRAIDKRVNLAIVTSTERLTEYKERHNTEVSNTKL